MKPAAEPEPVALKTDRMVPEQRNVLSVRGKLQDERGAGVTVMPMSIRSKCVHIVNYLDKF